MIFWCVPLVVLAFMAGGQFNKLFRPICVPFSIIVVYWLFYPDTVLVTLPVLLYGFLLTLGYGVNSRLMKWLRSEQAVRIVYGVLIAIPVLILSVITTNWAAILWVPVIVANSCIRMGSWGKIGKYDILPVDIIRGATLGLAVSCALA